ncbi:UNVERIFIED_CONTAM: hypothetical protein K2H54_056078 [Gekko kuhli]
MEAKHEEMVTDRNPLSLFDLSAAVVTSVMRHVEREVWALPGPILQGILPMLNIYYLERIEETAVKKGLSTQPIWCKLWCDIMKTRPSRFESIKCWRKKFLEAFFSNVLRGILDVSSDQRLRDPCFLPLLYTSQHVTELTIYNMLEGVAELMAKHNQGILENLTVSLRSLTFRHLLSSKASITGLVHTDRPVEIISLKTASHFRSVSILEFVSIRLNRNTCQMLGNLLSSWVSLEKLVLSLNGLGPNIFSILSGLRALSRHSDYHLHVVHISDTLSHVPCMNLVHSILSAVPLLRVLMVSFDLKTLMEWSRPEESLGSSSLEEEIPGEVLCYWGKLLLLETIEVERLLHALKEYSPVLKRLSFHDINLSHHSKDVLLLLQDPTLQEITFSFCRLFENCTVEFLSEIINAVKKNSSLKTLRLPGNRLGNHRLVALADIFSEDSSTSICHLDVSSNCIKPDGLLEFAKKLERYIAQHREQIKFTKLCLSQNWLDQDAVMAQEALWRLRAICSVVSDTWDSSQAFADYVSVM